MRCYSRPRGDLKLIHEGPRPGGIANQIAAQHARDVSVRLPLIPVRGAEGRAAGTGKAAEEEQHRERQSYYASLRPSVSCTVYLLFRYLYRKGAEHAENHRENLQIRTPPIHRDRREDSNPDEAYSTGTRE